MENLGGEKLYVGNVFFSPRVGQIRIIRDLLVSIYLKESLPVVDFNYLLMT